MLRRFLTAAESGKIGCNDFIAGGNHVHNIFIKAAVSPPAVEQADQIALPGLAVIDF